MLSREYYELLMKIKTPKDAGQYIAATRKALKWSQTDLATKIGKDQRFISRLENDPTSVSFGTVLMVLNVLNIYTDMTNQISSRKCAPEPHTAAQRKPKYYVNDSNSALKKIESRKFVSKATRTPVIISKKKTGSKND